MEEMIMYVHKPYWSDPMKELKTCLNFYRDLVNRIFFWDLMEFVAYLGYRDGIEWALEQLGRENVDSALLAEIEELDAKLRANADYLVNELELYKHIWRDEPEEHWWWYLDGGKPDGPRQVVNEGWPTPKMTPVAAIAEKRSEYSVKGEQD